MNITLGTIISSDVGPKISLPFEMPVTVANINHLQEHTQTSDNIQNEHQSFNSHAHKNVEQEELLEEEDDDDEEEGEEEDEVNKPSDENFPNDYSKLPSKYPTLISPTTPPHSMQTDAHFPLGFIPFNYYLTPSFTINKNVMVTERPTKKIPTNIHQTKDSNKPSTPMGISMTPNQLYPTSSQPIPNGLNGVLPQTQNIPPNPFPSLNSEFSNRPYSNGFIPYSNYMYPTYGFDGANQFPQQFEQINPFRSFYGNHFDRLFSGESLSASQNQNNPNLSISKNVKYSPLVVQSVHRKFNGFPQYFFQNIKGPQLTDY